MGGIKFNVNFGIYRYLAFYREKLLKFYLFKRNNLVKFLVYRTHFIRMVMMMMMLINSKQTIFAFSISHFRIDTTHIDLGIYANKIDMAFKMRIKHKIEIEQKNFYAKCLRPPHSPMGGMPNVLFVIKHSINGSKIRTHAHCVSPLQINLQFNLIPHTFCSINVNQRWNGGRVSV